MKDTKFLDGLRGFAAFYVLIHHSRWLLSESAKYRNGDNIFIKLFTNFLSIFRFGHEMVIFFFVLSGFVIHLSVVKFASKYSEKGIWKTFFIKRFNRIYPPFIFALLLTFLIDYVGCNIFHFSFYNLGSKYNSLTLSANNFSIKAFLGNLINLQGLNSGIPVFGTNGALWSLSYEWWFYIFYPLFYYLNKESILKTFILQIGLFCLSTILSYKYNIPIIFSVLQKMIIWWFGVLLAEVYIGRIKISFINLSYLVILAPFALIFVREQLYSDLIWGLGFVGIISYLMHQEDSNIFRKYVKAMGVIGGCSYTIYLIHLPIVSFIHAFLIQGNAKRLPENYTPLFLVVILIIFGSYILAKWVEKINIIPKR